MLYIGTNWRAVVTHTNPCWRIKMEVNVIPDKTHEKEIEEVVITMLQKCKCEAMSNSLEIPLEDFEDRITYYTGIDKIRIKQILSRPENALEKHSFDFITHIVILKCLYQFYERKELPTFKRLFGDVNTMRQTFKDYEQFKHEAKLAGFDYQTIFKNKKLLMEDPKITFERYLYLNKIRKLRQKNTLIYYVNVRIIGKDLTFKNHNQCASSSSGDEYFFHAISRRGLSTGVFCLQPTENDFYKWVVDVLLLTIDPSSAVVLGTSPLQGTLTKTCISMYDTKCDMQKWLQKYNVPYSGAMNKSQLYELVKKNNITEEMSRIDRVIKANGHEVLRLPTHFENLSPVEFIWEHIKGSSTINMQHDITRALLNLPVMNYASYEKDIQERENDLFLLDTAMDKVLEEFLLDLKTRDVETIVIDTTDRIENQNVASSVKEEPFSP